MWNPYPLLRECKMLLPLQKIVWQFLKKLKIELPYDLAIPHLGVYPKELKARSQRHICFYQHYSQ